MPSSSTNDTPTSKKISSSDLPMSQHLSNLMKKFIARRNQASLYLFLQESVIPSEKDESFHRPPNNHHNTNDFSFQKTIMIFHSMEIRMMTMILHVHLLKYHSTQHKKNFLQELLVFLNQPSGISLGTHTW